MPGRSRREKTTTLRCVRPPVFLRRNTDFEILRTPTSKFCPKFSAIFLFALNLKVSRNFIKKKKMKLFDICILVINTRQQISSPIYCTCAFWYTEFHTGSKTVPMRDASVKALFVAEISWTWRHPDVIYGWHCPTNQDLGHIYLQTCPDVCGIGTYTTLCVYTCIRFGDILDWSKGEPPTVCRSMRFLRYVHKTGYVTPMFTVCWRNIVWWCSTVLIWMNVLRVNRDRAE